jgi:hypothetical protein
VKAIEGDTIGQAWLAAADYLAASPSWNAFNLVVEVTRPAARTAIDRAAIKAVDEHLRAYDKHPVYTIAETIFPFAAYRREGAEGVYNTYPDRIYPMIKALKEVQWGTYAQRLVRWPTPTGELNQIQRVVTKIQERQRLGNRPYTASYELATSPLSGEEPVGLDDTLDLRLYDPNKDASRYYGGQCLSHISLKVRNGKEVLLTAMYRSHYYIEKALGNFVGLSRLQGFICNETGLAPGPLVCMSTYAVLDTGGGRAGSPSWGVDAVEALLVAARGEPTRKET